MYIGCVFLSQPRDVCIALWVQHVQTCSWICDTVHTVVIYTQFLVSSTALSSVNNYTVCSTSTIDRSRSCIFQYSCRLDIIRVQEICRASRHSIDNVQWLVTTEGTETTYTNDRRSTWLTVGNYSYTRNTTLKGLLDVTCRDYSQIFRANCRDRTSRLSSRVDGVTCYN